MKTEIEILKACEELSAIAKQRAAHDDKASFLMTAGFLSALKWVLGLERDKLHNLLDCAIEKDVGIIQSLTAQLAKAERERDEIKRACDSLSDRFMELACQK